MEVNITSSMYAEQRSFVSDIFSGKYSKVSAVAGRRAGKSYACDRVAIGLALREVSKEVLWCTPSHSQSQEAFDRVLEILSLVSIPYKANGSTSDRKITFPNGSKIKFKSANKYDNLRGNNPDFVILDEFAFFKEGAWQKVIEPYGISNSEIVFIAVSTYNGKDDFYNFIEEGKNPEVTNASSHKLHYSMNPVTNYEFIKQKRKSLPKAVFDQEYEGILVTGASQVFGDFTSLQTITEWATPKSEPQYYFGIDFAKNTGDGDATVITIMDDKGDVVLVHTVEATGTVPQVDELARVIKKYHRILGYGESNNMGDAMIDLLLERGIDIEKLNTNNQLKQDVVSEMLIDIDNSEIQLPTSELCEKLDAEMSQYVTFRTPSGLVTYSHPKGSSSIHDDSVDSLLFANHARHTLVESYIQEEIDYEYY